MTQIPRIYSRIVGTGSHLPARVLTNAELEKQIDEAKTLAEVEDIYRPYKQKRRTRATIAKEKRNTNQSAFFRL